jgi:hypothetical protein
MKNLLLLMACAGLSIATAAPRVIYTKVFPGSEPAYVRIVIEQDGGATYQEAADEEPEKFKLDPPTVEAIFALADKLQHFTRKLESDLKVAKVGEKTYRWEDGGSATEVKYNYSTDVDAQALQDWFERITQSERVLIELRRTARFDRLGVHEVLLRLESLWSKKRLVGPDQFLSQLDRISKNESYMNMARDRATVLAEQFRGLGKAPQ